MTFFENKDSTPQLKEAHPPVSSSSWFLGEEFPIWMEQPPYWLLNLSCYYFFYFFKLWEGWVGWLPSWIQNDNEKVVIIGANPVPGGKMADRGFKDAANILKPRPAKSSDQKGSFEGCSRNLNSHAPSPGCSLHTNQWRTMQTLQENLLFHTPRLCIEEFSTVYIFIQMKVFLYFDNRKQWPIFRVIKSGTNETSHFSQPVPIKATVGDTPRFTVETYAALKSRLICRLQSLED